MWRPLGHLLTSSRRVPPHACSVCHINNSIRTPRESTIRYDGRADAELYEHGICQTFRLTQAQAEVLILITPEVQLSFTHDSLKTTQEDSTSQIFAAALSDACTFASHPAAYRRMKLLNE
jgi:hypothetical protein